MNSRRGSGSPTLLSGILLLFVSLAFFLWLQHEPRTESSHREMPAIADERVELPRTVQRDRQPLSTSSDANTGSDNSPPGPNNIQSAPADSGRLPRLIKSVLSQVKAQAESEQTVYEEPLGNLAISGRVLTRLGTPVAGIAVTATATHLFEGGRRKAIPHSARRLRVTTGYDGAYKFDDLANGEYQLRTVATDRYTEARLHVRAGVDFADLTVTSQQDLRVQGLVTTSSGEPLARVKLRANLADSREVMTNKDGRYVFNLKLPDNVTSVLLRATRDGYKDREVALASKPSDNTNPRELDIVMQATSAAALAEVSGSVRGPDRDPVAGQQIQLSSAEAGQRHRATTGSDGRFVIRGVEPGDDYMLSVNAGDVYQDYFRRDIEVPEKGLTLNIELLDRETGVLRGQMVNVFGQAVPDYSLVLQTIPSSYDNQRVIGDASGNFEVEKAPAGELRLKTKSNPFYSVDGIQLAPDTEKQITVVLDWGSYDILGQVMDEDGLPVAVPNISLTWTHLQNGIRTTARRTAAADERGNFRFTQLGPGNHRLIVNAAGYRPVILNHDVAMQGSDISVKLFKK